MHDDYNCAREDHVADQTPNQPEGTTSRRAFLGKSLAVSAGAIGIGLLGDGLPAFAQESSSAQLTKGDVAILRFLSAIEQIEVDLWQQYNELGGIQDKEVPGGSGNAAYTNALTQLDGDMPQYIHDNTEDEISHHQFLNAYLMSKGADPVNLDHYRVQGLGSTAPGAQNVPRLTNLKELTVDTSWWGRYRSRTGNPDLGDTSFAQAVPGLAKGKFPAIPRDANDLVGSTDTSASNHLQAIANTAGFHFGYIEQGGTSLYPSLAQRVTSPEVLRVLLSIGPTEAMHFQTWHDKAGNAPSITDPTNGLFFPNLQGNGNEDTQSNLIMPEPTQFLVRNRFPAVSIIRPTLVGGTGGAVATVKSFVADGLFIGQSPYFVQQLLEMATLADEVRRGY
jgi:hypothetical protein